MQLDLSRESMMDEIVAMTTPTSISANGSFPAQPLTERDLFRTLVENVSDTIFLIDLDSEECIYVSPSVNTLLGLDAHALIGRRLTDFVHPDDKAKVVAYSACRRRGSAVRTTVTRMSHQNGRWVWVQATASPVLNLGGRSATVFTVSNRRGARACGDSSARREASPTSRARPDQPAAGAL